jgi:hypothetical protein
LPLLYLALHKIYFPPEIIEPFLWKDINCKIESHKYLKTKNC